MKCPIVDSMRFASRDHGLARLQIESKSTNRKAFISEITVILIMLNIDREVHIKMYFTQTKHSKIKIGKYIRDFYYSIHRI